MYEIELRVHHDCPYSRIANLFDFAIYEFCSDLYDLLIIPKSIDKYDLANIKAEVLQPDSVEVYQPENEQSISYIYFNCMCNRDINVVPTIERHGGIVQYPIKYENGYEYYKIISLNNKTQSAVLGVVDHIENLEILRINELGRDGVFRSQFLSVHQLMSSLTDRQIEVIVRAYKNGYYEIPRRTRTKDIANEFGVSRAATEKSLRKAENQILENVIPYLLFHQKLWNSKDSAYQVH